MADELYRRLSCGRCALSFQKPRRAGKSPKECDSCLPIRQAELNKARVRKRADRARALKAQIPQQCKGCSVAFTALKQRKFCIKECGVMHRRAVSGVQTNAQRYAAARAASQWTFTCEHCKSVAHRIPSSSNKKNGYNNRFCSMTCRVAYKKDHRTPRFTPYWAGRCTACDASLGGRLPIELCGGCRKNQRVTSAYQTNLALHKASAMAYSCEDCSIQYCPLYRSWLGRVCPHCIEARSRALKRIHRNRRKAAQRGVTIESVNDLKVLERDHWKCYLCGCDTPKHLRGSYESNAPEVEHVVPLSRGGAHAYSNVRCACRACNLIKCDFLLEDIGGVYRGGIGFEKTQTSS